MRDLFKRFVTFLPRLWSNWITMLGAVITTLAGIAILSAIAVNVAAGGLNPYASTILFLVLPGVFLVGLVMIPVGLVLERRRRKRVEAGAEDTEESLEATFVKAMESPVVRRKVMFVTTATVLNIVILGVAGHQAVTFMDTPKFCGTVCHKVMQPEYEAYVRSPHSRVACVDCHIGPGASWAVKAKVDGIRQVYGVIAGNYDRPIMTPVHDLRPARDTCEHCHWPAKFHGNRVNFYTRYGDDEKNTPAVTAILLKVGGENPRTGQHEGIHWHVSPKNEVRYEVLDVKRRKIGRIWKVRDGQVLTEYLPPGEAGAVLDTRVMDCVDCHNRPTHIFDRSPESAIDLAFEQGQLDGNVPWLHEVAAKTLREGKPAREEADAYFRKTLGDTYAALHPQQQPDGAALDRAAAVLANLYRRNVYPQMNLTWGTYDNHLGHGGAEPTEGIGCYRCHNDEHKTAEGKPLSGDCDQCHEIVAQEETPESLPEPFRPLLHPAQ